MESRRAITLFAALIMLSGCSPYVGTCSWVVPEAGNVLATVEARKPVDGECDCIGCDAPGRFLLSRERYTLEFWNGDRWYPELLARARSKSGAVLALSADTPEWLRMAPHVPAKDAHGFEYFMRFEADDASKPARTLLISVIDADGDVLGTERIEFRVVTRKDFAIESI